MNDLHLHHPQKKTLRVATLAEKKAIQDECQLPLVSLFLLQKVLLDKCLLLTNLVSTYGSYMEVDLDFSSNRKLKNFLRSSFVIVKSVGAFESLPPEALGSSKEQGSFFFHSGRSRPQMYSLSYEEEQEAKASGRILGC